MQSKPTGWVCEPYDVAAAVRLAGALGMSRMVGAILARRGFSDAEEARRFLAAGERHDPGTLPGAVRACELILRHLERGSRIAVFGSYDVDGVCSTAMLVRTLRALGGDPLWELPSRFDKGYGLSVPAVERLAARGVELLVTVDCGVTAVEQVAAATAVGLDVVITDHHRPGPTLPDCTLVHPALGAYGCPELCAAGVVLKLSEALHTAAGAAPRSADEDLDLAALATVCDLVPLRDENRRIVREGLVAMARTRKPGLRALMAAASVEPAELTEQHLGFRLGPRINAAGRMRRADAALELLLTEDEGRAEEVARELDLLNRDRREAETRITFRRRGGLRLPGQPGSAGRGGGGLAPRSGGDRGLATGRALAQALRRHRPGGRRRTRLGAQHLALRPSRRTGRLRAAPDPLRRPPDGRRSRARGRRCGGLRQRAGHPRRASPRPRRPDPARARGRRGARRAARPRPSGRAGAPAPVRHGQPAADVAGAAARFQHVAGMGEDKQHSRFTLVTAGGARSRGVAFGSAPQALAPAQADNHDIALRLERNRWNGMVEPRVLLRALCPTRPGQLRVLGEEKTFWERFDRARRGVSGPRPRASSSPSIGAARGSPAWPVISSGAASPCWWWSPTCRGVGGAGRDRGRPGAASNARGLVERCAGRPGSRERVRPPRGPRSPPRAGAPTPCCASVRRRTSPGALPRRSSLCSFTAQISTSARR